MRDDFGREVFLTHISPITDLIDSLAGVVDYADNTWKDANGWKCSYYFLPRTSDPIKVSFVIWCKTRSEVTFSSTILLTPDDPRDLSYTGEPESVAREVKYRLREIFREKAEEFEAKANELRNLIP